MKRLKLTIASILVHFPFLIFSQASLNISAGGNISKINAIDRLGYTVDTKYKPGLQVGLTADIPVGERFIFYPGVHFVNKGYKSKNEYGTTTLSPNILEVPLDFLYKASSGEGNLLVGLGPYVSYGLGGKWKFKKGNSADTAAYLSNGTLEFLDDYAKRKGGTVIPYSRPIDVGGNVILGYERNTFKILLDGQLGLLNLEPLENGIRPVYATQQTIGIKLQFVYKLLTFN